MPKNKPLGTPDAPTEVPTEVPTGVPTDTPTGVPTDAPTGVPTDAPTGVPADAPTGLPEVNQGKWLKKTLTTSLSIDTINDIKKYFRITDCNAVNINQFIKSILDDWNYQDEYIDSLKVIIDNHVDNTNQNLEIERKKIYDLQLQNIDLEQKIETLKASKTPPPIIANADELCIGIFSIIKGL